MMKEEVEMEKKGERRPLKIQKLRRKSNTSDADIQPSRSSSKAIADKHAPMNTPSRHDEATLAVVMQVLIGSKSSVPVESSPIKVSDVQSSETENQLVPMESSCLKSPAEAQDGTTTNQLVPEKKVLASDLHGNELPIQSLDNNNLPKREANLVLPPLDNEPISSDHINVNGYMVKRELAPLLMAIFLKYGDIAKESVVSMESRPVLLEWVCSIYKKLEALTFLQLTPLEIKSMLGQMKDLQNMKMKIGWLNERLCWISKVREMCDSVSTTEEFEARTVVMTDEKTKAIQCYEEEMKKLQEKLQQEKDELSMVDEIKKLSGKALVHGLV